VGNQFRREGVFRERAFTRQQFLFPLQAAGKTAEFSPRGEHAMAGHQHGNRVGAARLTDGADRFGPANRAGDLRVTSGHAGWNRSQRVPDAPLKPGAGGEIERRQISRRPARERFVQRPRGRAQPSSLLP